MVVSGAFFSLGREVGRVIAEGASFNAEVLEVAFEVVSAHLFGQGWVLGGDGVGDLFGVHVMYVKLWFVFNIHSASGGGLVM